MKKLILFVTLFFITITTVFGANINTIDLEMEIDIEGNAKVVETWVIVRQKDTLFRRNFKNAKNIEITDISFSDAKGSNYHEVTKMDKNDTFAYTYVDKGNKKYIEFNTDPGENIYTISYTINNVITKYTDSLGMDYYLIPNNPSQSIGIYSAKIKTPYYLDETNTGLFMTRKVKNSAGIFEEGILNINASNIDENSELRFLINFGNEDYVFNNFVTIDKSYQEVIDGIKTGSGVIEDILDSITTEVIVIIISVIVLLMVIIIISRIIARRKNHNEYYGILEPKSGKLLSYDEANYIESVPLNNDLYSISFFGGYYKIINNRSNLINALVLKWLLEGLISLELDRGRPYIKFNLNIGLDRKLDNDLYKMLIEASNGNALDAHKMKRFATSSYLRLMTWFNMGFNESISSELTRGTITKEKRMGKIYTQLGEKTIEYANEIQGLKKYLLNFNQVPRQTPLNEVEYRNLLIAAELLGIGDNVAHEILRKNPDNALAQKILDYTTYREIFKNTYNDILTPYKEFARDKAFLEAYEDEEEENNNSQNINTN